MSIQTPRLTLVSAGGDDFRALANSEEALAERLGVALDPDWLGFPDARSAVASGGDHLQESPQDEGWWTYWFVYRDENRLCGMGGFKGAPDHAGIVEIGYTISSHWRGRGLATEAARGMIDHAFADQRVGEVRAHTLPEHNASTAILQRVGMSFVGEVVDPDDGLVWRWSLTRP